MILDNPFGTSDSVGFNNDMTLGDIARELTHSRPQALALVDPSDRPIFTDGARRKLTWAQFDEEVARLTRRLLALQLGRDAVIAYQMPNIVETFIVFMAILRAGCIAAPLPLPWRKQELTQALAQITPRAVITTVRAGPVNHAEMLRNVCADVFSVRFVLAYGRNLPDGVVPLDDDICPIDEEPEEDLRRSHPLSEHVAVITWDSCADGMIPVARSHTALIALGLSHVLETGIGGGDILATAQLHSGIAGLGLGFVTTLLAGASLVLNQPFSSRGFAGTLITENVTHALLPGMALQAMLEATRLPNRPLKSVTALWRPADSATMLSRFDPHMALADAVAFGEMGVTVRKRQIITQPTLLRSGTVMAGESGPALISLRGSKNATLEISGPMVPHATLPVPSSSLVLPLDDQGWLDTGFGVRENNGILALTGERSGVISIGGLSFPQTPTQRALENALGEKDASKLDYSVDPLFGQRVDAPDGIPPERIRQRIHEAGLSPALTPSPRKPA